MSKEIDESDRPWQSYHTVYTNAKAGMDGVDKEKVQKIVYEMSKGSKYFENEERKDAYIKQKIENMRAQCEKLTEMDISHYQMVADKRMVELEAARDLSKTWLHVDMDAFYAAVETLADPSLKGKPMAVGGMSMISTANYEARKFGVRAAMPGFIARKLCPELVFVPVDFTKYNYYSDLTRKVFQKYDHNFIAASLDEAYLDITEICKERSASSEEIAGELRKDIYEGTGLTCSAGVAPNLLLAKVCSDINKPNGQFVLPNDRTAVRTFISSLPIRKIGGIGKVTESLLREVLGIKTCDEMLVKRAFLYALFSSSSSDSFLSAAMGLGKTDAPEGRLRKSMSSERTFSATGDEAKLYEKLANISETLSTEMQKEGLYGRTLTLKLKTASFEVRSRAVTLPKFIYSSEDILNHASKLLKAELPLSLRLMGLRMSHFSDCEAGNADPLQKTLKNFVIVGDASTKAMSSSSSVRTDMGGNQLMVDADVDHHIDGGEKISISGSDYTYEENSMNTNSLHHLELDYQKDGAASDKDAYPAYRNDSLSEVDITQLREDGGVEALRDVQDVNGENKEENIMENPTALLSIQEEQFYWIDDYKCSLCGYELPQSFVEERQEHSDYHFAEMLQKEESHQTPRTVLQRSNQKPSSSGETKSKKRKMSAKDGKHIPIDLFFSKTNQNF
ncbi:DNA polymerase kappa isoform X1 [Papaver somniferum]|uniref:DNA polymerase kappa isoform X1 n=1 Tax=Papaver somniferum TaxID=3469 RepID=UPI000E7025E8|nr:DNA polymerase kappa isoform X1 [Papaver somniferum]